MLDFANAREVAPGVACPLDEFVPLPEHLRPVWETFVLLSGFESGTEPANVSAHLDSLDISGPKRRRIYLGVMALESEHRKIRAQNDADRKQREDMETVMKRARGARG